MSPFDDSHSLPPEIRQTTQDIAEGATRGVLSWSKETILALAKKFLNKELVFIEDQQTIEIVKEQLKTAEWLLFNRYVQDKDMQLLIKMGLTLRALEKQKRLQALQNLRDKISTSKYGKRGLHIAQFVQSKLLKEYVNGIIDKASSESELIQNINDMLSYLEVRSSFIKKEDSPDIKVAEILTRIQAHAPESYIVFAKDSALPICKLIIDLLKEKIKYYDYCLELKKTDDSMIIIILKDNA